ncbi:hypothetical protein pb186bvf_004743 [Paramecium bursaria]
MFNKIIQLISPSKTNLANCFVQPGESLFDISFKYDCNIWKIKELNNMNDIHVTPGQNLIVQQPQQQEEHYSFIDRMKLLEIDTSFPILYKCNNHFIEGIMHIKYDFIKFDAKPSKLQKKLNKKLTQLEIDQYGFIIMAKEIQKIKFNPISEILNIYIWGCNGMLAPIVEDSLVNGIEIHLQQKKGLTKQVKQYIKKICNITSESGKIKSMEAVSFLIYLINYEHEKVLQDSLCTFFRTLNYQIKPIECCSHLTYIQHIVMDMESGQVQQVNLNNKEKSITFIPKLNAQSRILDNFKINQILKHIPQYLQSKDWYLAYSPTQNGTSYSELIRRTQNIGHHLIILQDSENNIFGSYVTDSWFLSTNVFFGSGEAFLYKFKGDRIQVFHSTGINSFYQMADETGLSIGAGDKYGLYIRHDLNRGSTNQCETFNNSQLTQQENFGIIEMEFWCFDEDAIKYHKLLEQQKSIFK